MFQYSLEIHYLLRMYLWCVGYCELLEFKIFFIVFLHFLFEDCSEVWLWQIPWYKFRWTCYWTFRCNRIKRAMGTCLPRCKLLGIIHFMFLTFDCILISSILIFFVCVVKAFCNLFHIVTFSLLFSQLQCIYYNQKFLKYLKHLKSTGASKSSG